MPKPENPGSQGKGRNKPKGQTIEKWTAKGYKPVVIASGETEAEQVPLADPSKESIVLAGHVFGDDGKRLKGRERPHLSVVESATGAIVSTAKPVPEDVTVLYKVVDDVAEEDEETEPTPPTPPVM